jgi:hypothetical protein
LFGQLEDGHDLHPGEVVPERVEAGGGRVLVTFAPSTPVTPERILAVIGRPGSGVRMRKEFMLEAAVPSGPWPAVRDALRALLESLA